MSSLVAEDRSIVRWATAFSRAGHSDRAARSFERLFKLRKSNLGVSDVQTIDAESHWGWSLSKSGRYEQAELHLLKSYRDIQTVKGTPADWLPTYCERLADLYKGWGKAEQEQQWRQEQQKLLQSREYQLSKALALYREGSKFLSANKNQEAETVLRQSVSIRERLMPDAWNTFNAQSTLGAALSKQQKYAEAEPLLLSAYEGLKQRESTIGKDYPYLQWSLERLVMLYDAWVKPNTVRD